MTDTFTIFGMVIVMFVLRWDFALIALTVMPFLTIFVFRVNRRSRRPPGRSARASPN